METRFVNAKTAIAHLAPAADAEGHDRRSGILIFGDEVDATHKVQHGRRLVQFRGRKTWIDDDKLGEERSLECYFIDVGTGDSTFIVTPAGKKILIDGGLNRRALGFLAWKYRLHKTDEALDLDLLVLSHADDDHLAGLAPILSDPRIRVHRIVHSGIAKFNAPAMPTGIGDVGVVNGQKVLLTRHHTLDDLRTSDLSSDYRTFYQAIRRERVDYQAVDSTTPPLQLGDPEVQIEVLGPRLVPDPATGAAYLPWLGSEGKTINGHSVVLRLTYRDVTILLPGDINQAGARHLMEDRHLRELLPAHVFKAPHHGSHDFEPAWLELVRPQISVISSGDDRDHGHPRAVFTGAIGRVSRSQAPLVFSTEIGGRFVELSAAQPDTPPAGAPEGERASRYERPARLFKRSLHGMINVRTDGRDLYAARRVAASYQWESYGPVRACA
ncbi:MAG: MBL fold metallo-hydrolase [Polyangiaceae bacterium]